MFLSLSPPHVPSPPLWIWMKLEKLDLTACAIKTTRVYPLSGEATHGHADTQRRFLIIFAKNNRAHALPGVVLSVSTLSSPSGRSCISQWIITRKEDRGREFKRKSFTTDKKIERGKWRSTGPASTWVRCEKCRRGAGPLAGPRRPGDGPRARQTCASRRAPLSTPPPPQAPAPPPGSALRRPPGWGRLPVAAAVAGASAGSGVQRPPWARSAGSQCCFDPIWCCFCNPPPGSRG